MLGKSLERRFSNGRAHLASKNGAVQVAVNSTANGRQRKRDDDQFAFVPHFSSTC
jgi:hypothetical protein